MKLILEKITTCYFNQKTRTIKIVVLFSIFFSLYSFRAQSQISTGVITGSPFCACDSVHVPFISIGVFVGGNIYTAELSDSLGSFTVPVVIGTFLDSTNSGIIDCMIPCGTLTGSGYLIRVTSSTPPIIGSDNGVNIIINASVIPSVSISALVDGIICTDTTVTFTANPTNEGTTPMYQWQINGVNVGMDSAVFTTSSLLSIGDSVSVTLTSSAGCSVPSIVQADTIVNCVAITTGIIAGGSFCTCDSLNVPFTSTGFLTVGNMYIAQLSDSVGSFATPVTIGSLLSTSNSNSIACVIPCGTPAGTGYLIRVIASAPSATGSDNGLNIIV
ncbi:MAG: hypothetical protein K8R85_06635, partial [Bacteroidetes bacterium]|nr:hypothetical protein [Bacteroidota bacterium]